MQKVTNIEIKSDKNNNPMKVCTFDSGVKVYVNSKYDETIYNEVEVGKSFEVYKDDKDYWKIKYDKPAPTKAPNGYGKQALMDKAMDKKATTIERFQQTKEEAIAMAGSATDATSIVTALIGVGGVSDIKYEWEKWRKYFYDQRTIPFVSGPTKQPTDQDYQGVEYPTEEINPDEIPF
jgi:hypothetical protein